MPQDPKKKNMKAKMAATIQKTVMTYDKDGKPFKKKVYPKKELKVKKISEEEFFDNGKKGYRQEQKKGGPTF